MRALKKHLPLLTLSTTTSRTVQSIYNINTTIVRTFSHLRPVGRAYSLSTTGTDSIYEFAKKKPNPISVKKLLAVANNVVQYRNHTILSSAQWLHNEIPIRVARQVTQIDRLPYGLCLMSSVRQVRHWYKDSFNKLTKFPYPRTIEQAEEYTRLLEELFERHDGTLMMMAKGVHELKSELKTEDHDISEFMDLHEHLDSFYTSRIGIRLLVGHHLEITKEPRKGYAGLVLKSTSPIQIIRDATDNATHVCSTAYGTCPQVFIHGRTDLTFAYIPAHLYYPLFELLKNSMRAVVEFHNKEPLPPVRVIVADHEDNEDVSLKISDEGGGIKRSFLPKVWSYTFSTASKDVWDAHIETDFSRSTPIAGFGYGLPLSRLYSKYFGGDLQILSMEGYGTDAYLQIPRIGDVDEAV